MNSSVANESIEIFLRIVVTGDSRMKKVGGHCGAKEKVGGATWMSILQVIFHCFED